MHTTSTPITMRRAQSTDAPALWRLAALDSAPAPRGDTIIAEREGSLIAAIGGDGRAIADPFERTAAIVSMLRAYTHTAGAAAC